MVGGEGDDQLWGVDVVPLQGAIVVCYGWVPVWRPTLGEWTGAQQWHPEKASRKTALSFLQTVHYIDSAKIRFCYLGSILVFFFEGVSPWLTSSGRFGIHWHVTWRHGWGCLPPNSIMGCFPRWWHAGRKFRWKEEVSKFIQKNSGHRCFERQILYVSTS